MLTNLSIKNFAVIQDLNLDLNKGLNIFTGETGAGKSVIIEAISMALGSRADTSYVRRGCDKAVISLTVDLDDCSISKDLEEFGLPYENPLVLTREISSNGKSNCRVNGIVVSLNILACLCKKIADIHGQYDQQILLDEDNHLGILDLYTGEECNSIKNKCADLYNKYTGIVSSINNIKKNKADNERQRDFLSFEFNEIKNASLKENEDTQLEEEIKLMQNSEKVFEALSSSNSNIFASENSAYNLLGNAISELDSIKGISSDIDELIARLNNAYYELDDSKHELRSLKDRVSFSEADLDSAIERLELINKLKRKYGGSIETVLEYANTAEKKINNIECSEEELEELTKQLSLVKSDLLDVCSKLSFARKESAKSLESRIDKELSELNFSNARFKVCFEPCAASATGSDLVRFLISANIGEDPKPISKVASGGELSRIMLALKRIIGDIDGIPTMIFDEIDTGISGATAAVVGEKLKAISKNHQVICITHLPQIASLGNSHYKIFKTSDETSTYTSINSLNMEERIEELARLLSGSSITDSARAQAKELLGIHG